MLTLCIPPSLHHLNVSLVMIFGADFARLMGGYMTWFVFY